LESELCLSGNEINMWLCDSVTMELLTTDDYDDNVHCLGMVCCVMCLPNSTGGMLSVEPVNGLEFRYIGQLC
jgi:hypothetical protein